MFVLCVIIHTSLTFLLQKKYCRQLLNTPFPQYQKLQMIMEKSIAKGRFAHKGTAQAPSNPSIVDDIDYDTAGHAVPTSSSSTMISPAIQEHSEHTLVVNNSTSMDLDDPVLPSTLSGLPPLRGLSSLSVPSASTTTSALVSSLLSASVSSIPPTSASVPSVKSASSVKSAKSKTSEKRKRASEDDPTPDQPLSKQLPNASKSRSTASGSTKTNTSLSALIGATGAINNLNTTMQQSLFQSDARRIELAMELIKDVNYIDDNDKGALSFYYSNNPNAAGSLVAMSDTQRENTLRYALQMIQRQAPF